MKILFLSVHSVLEYQELSILTELDEKAQAGLDIEVFSVNGAYMNPTQSGDYMRSVIPNGRHYPHLFNVALQCDKDNLHPELIDWADVIFMHHNSAIPNQDTPQRWLSNNWDLFTKKKKRVVWRSIGQSTPEIEEFLQSYKKRGLVILRYSPYEHHIPNYAGHDAIIRFSEDPSVYDRWIGERERIITVAQSMKQRGNHLGFPIFEEATEGLNRKVFGPGNEDLGELWGGVIPYSELKANLREDRAYFYFGTVPAPYTLTFIEAMMTGIPVIAAGPKLRQIAPYNWPCYEIPDIISNGVNGFISDSVHDLRGYAEMLLADKAKAEKIGEAGRNTAIKLFGRKERMDEWVTFLKTL